MCTHSGIFPNSHMPGEPVPMSFPLIEEIDFVTANNIHSLHQFAQQPQVDDKDINVIVDSFTKNNWDDIIAEFDAMNDAGSSKPLLQTVNPAWLVNTSRLGLSPGSETPPLDEHIFSPLNENIFSENPSSNTSNSSITPNMAENAAVINLLPDPFEIVEGSIAMSNVPPTPVVDLNPTAPPQNGPGTMPAQPFNMQQAFPQLYCPQPYYPQPMYSQRICPPDPNAQSNMAMVPMYPMNFSYNMPPFGYVSPQYQHPYQMMPSMGPLINQQNQQQSFAVPATITPSPPPKPSPEPVSNKRVFSFINQTAPNFVANPNNHGRWKIDSKGNRQYLNAPPAKRPCLAKL